MDLGVLLESPQGSQSSSRVGACTCAFLRAVAAVSRFHSRGSGDLWLSLESFPRGFPTGLSYVSRWCESILSVKAEAVQGKQVPVVPVVTREHLPQLGKIQQVLPSRRDEAHFRCGVSRLITSSIWNFQRVLHTLAATQEVPRQTRLHSRGSTGVPPTSRGAPFPPRSSK